MSIKEFAKRAYFAVAYNTTVSVNMLLTLGAVTPYLLLQLANGTLSIPDAIADLGLTLLTTYYYIVVYITNDYLDRRDDASQSPKRTTKNILGRRYLWIVLTSLAAVFSLGAWLWPSLTVLLTGYILALTALSIVHSRSPKTKAYTIFLERLCKFVMPLVVVYVHTPEAHVVPFIIASLLIFPWSFMADYTYSGYFRDKLRKPINSRFLTYAAYYALLTLGFSISGGMSYIAANAVTIAAYVGIYTLLAITASRLAIHLPWNRLDAHYDPHVANEKRLLLTYGGVQIAALLSEIYFLSLQS